MSQRPLIILAFSHVNQTLTADSRNLSKEQFQIQSLLSPLAQQELCEISVIAQCTVDLLFDAIKKDGHRLIGLHYSSDVETLIKIREGELKSMERAFRGKLGKYLGSLEKLKWVFLNGDGSQEQSEALIQHGVSLIVRSQNLINDDAAFRFAFFFYQALAHGHCLGKCCYVARDEVRSDYSHKAKLTYSQDLPSGYGSDWPFDFMVNPNRWQPLLWHIHSDSQKNDHLLPKIEDQPLPQLPFKDFEAFFEEDSSLFFGRQELIRQIFDALTLNAQRKPFMILSGPAGSGKTSLVCSSLGIRLKDLFEVRYQPFDQDGLSTLSSALGVDENAYLSKEWHSIETAYHQSHLKPQIITDLMNEVQAAFRKHYRTEKADFQTDFQSFFNTMKTLWLQSDQVDGDNLISKLGELFEYQKRMTQLQNQNLEEEEQLRPLLVFMDDMEKAFDLQSSDQKDRQEKFWEMLKILAFDQEKQMKGSLIFMIDERYVGQLERALAQQNLGWLKFDIPALDENLIADYLRQFALSFKFKEHYPILIDDRFAQTVASDLAKVDEPLGWRLHALLRLLWQRSIRKPVKWTLEAYEPIQKIGLDLKALLIQRIDDFLQSAKVQMSEDELKEELMIDLLAQLPKFEEIDVEELLKSYLQYESQLPEPWLSHREMIKFQSIWFFNQCIDAGLISGYLNLGENLPKGKIKCLHPSIYEAIQEKKNQLLKKHSYLLERFKQEIEQKIRLSHTELLEIQDLFFKQALPTLKEAEYLQKAIAENRKADAPTIIQNNAIQHQVYSDQQKKRALFFKFAPILLLIVSLSTCFSIQQKQSQIESKAKRLQVQMLLSQADEQLKQNQPHMSVALLKEIDQLQDLQTSNPIWQAQWQQTTIHTLQKPIPSKFEQISRIPQKVWFSDQGILSLYEDAKAVFYELADFKENLELTTSQWVANSDDGKQWVSIEGHELKFWTKNKQPSIKRIQSVQIKSLALNHEGTVAAILDDQGVVQLHRSYDYPMTQLKGHQQSPIVEMKVSIDGRELALLDQEGHLQKYKFNEGEQSALILVPVAENEEKFKVKAFEWVSAKTNEAQGLVVHYVLDDQQMIKYYPDRENKSQNQQGKTIYEGPSKVVAMVVSKENGRLLYALSEQQLYYEQLLNPSSTPKGIKIDLKNPTENPLKISQDGKKALMKIENKVFLIQLDPLQIRMIELLSQAVSLDQFDFSSNGQFIYATLEHEIQVWHAQLGQMAQKFAFGRSNIVGAKMYGDDLYVLLDQIGQKERTGLYHWDMNDHLQSAPLYWQQEEIESIDFIDQSAISISANHKGYLHFWNNQGDLIATAIERQKLSKVMHLNEQKLLIASFDDEIKVYPLVDQSLKEGDKILEIKAILTLKHAQSISSFTLTKNQIISADRQGLIKIWDLQGKLKGEIKASEMAIKQIEVAPQNDWFVSVAMNGKGKLWRLSEQNGQVIGQQAKELSIKIDQVKFDQQSVYISDIQGGLHQIKLQGTSLEINQLIPNQRLEDDLEEKVVSAIDLDNQKYHVQSQKYALQSYDLNGQIPMQSIALPTAQLSKIVAQKESLFLGDTDGQIWLWQSENQKQNFLQIGEHQSEIMDIKVDSQNQLLLSRSSHQAFLWKGKWDAQTLSAKLKTMPKICLKPEQRMLILGEERTQADDEYEACLNR